MTNSIANLVISLKNANLIGKPDIKVAHSKKLENIASVLKLEGFISSYEVIDIGNNKKELKIVLKYDSKKNPVFTDIQQVSKPGLRAYSESKKIPYVRNGLGIAVVSTNKGIVSDKYARENNVGGEIILKI
jgi:small subunit ribosomal protein S8